MNTQQLSLPSNAVLPSYCWAPQWDSAKGRNRFVRFSQTVNLAEAPATAVIHLFADTRYRLFVNGRVLRHGPCRFFPSAPEYDSVDLLSSLQQGTNVLEVEVWTAGSPIFQAIEAPPVFWAAGKIHSGDMEIDLSTPGGWCVAESAAWQCEAVAWSFAIGPVEILDIQKRQGERNTQPMVRAVAVGDSGHGLLTPCPLPQPEVRLRQPVSCDLHAGGTRHREQFHWLGADFGSAIQAFDFSVKKDGLFRVWIHSVGEQTIEAGLFWATHFLNGEPLETWDDPARRNRKNARLSLHPGWNGLVGRFQLFAPFWCQPLALPADCGLRLGEEGALRPALLGPLDASSEGSVGPDLAALSLDPAAGGNLAWCPIDPHAPAFSPAWEVAWELPVAEPAKSPSPSDFPLEVQTGGEGVGMVTLDFGFEVFGRLNLTLSAEAGCEVDASFDEALHPDGRVDMFGSLWSVHSTDRYRCGVGRSVIEGFHNRGGRYLQITVRAPVGSRVVLQELSIVESKTPAEAAGAFRCDDPFWSWLWETGVRTLDASLEDVWSDSPWREQGCYLGDSHVQFHAHACLSGDMRLPRRILRLFAQGQRPDGQIPCVVPAAMDQAHPDFSLLCVRFLRDFWAHTGDDDFVRELWPTVVRVLQSPTWIEGREGLVRVEAGPLFIDWSVEAEARQGFSSVLNVFFIDALRCAAELAPAAGANPAVFASRADTSLRALHTELWDSSTGRLRCTILESGEIVMGRALHANALAFARGMLPAGAEKPLLDWLLVELEDNADKIIRCHDSQSSIPRKTSGQLEPYFLFFLLEALGQRGDARAFDVIADMWGLMRERGATTFWESVLQSAFGTGSLCHSWSVAPLVFAARYLLGVQQPVAGDPRVVAIRPFAGILPPELTNFSGSVATAYGLVEVAWQRAGDKPALVSSQIPEGLKESLRTYEIIRKKPRC